MVMAASADKRKKNVKLAFVFLLTYFKMQKAFQLFHASFQVFQKIK